MLILDAEELLTQVRSSASGPRVAAVVDVDGTLVQGQSAALLRGRREQGVRLVPGVRLPDPRRLAGLGAAPTTDAAARAASRAAVAAWAGRPESHLDEVAGRAYPDVAAALFHEAWRVVKAHQRMRHTVALVTTTVDVQVRRLAAELGVEHVICTGVEVTDGTLTGRVSGEIVGGEAKADAVRAWARRHRVTLSRSYAYGDGEEDIPLLRAVGHPVAVNPQRALRREATDHEWPVVEFHHRPDDTDLLPQLRANGIWAILAGAGGTGMAMSLLSGDRWRGINFTQALFTHLAGALSDIRVDVVRGEEHLWSHRPAVFLINHQSDLGDLLTGATVLREHVTALAKKEAAKMPVVGQIISYAQFAFVDRADSAQAREALSQAIERLHQGISIVVAPEGTRSYTPSVGRFKKGGFHLAMQAEVPIVPIVIRNSGQLTTRSSRTVSPGTVEVVVHPPIRTDGWTLDDLNRAVDEVHRLYVDTLEEWPGPPAAPPTPPAARPRRNRTTSGGTG